MKSSSKPVVVTTELNRCRPAANGEILIEQHIATLKQISDALETSTEGTPPAKKEDPVDP